MTVDTNTYLKSATPTVSNQKNSDPSFSTKEVNSIIEFSEFKDGESILTISKNRIPEKKIPIDKLVNNLEDVARTFNRKLKFEINEKLNEITVKVIDSETDKVIREIPSEEIQRLRERLREAIGLLFDKAI